MTPSVPARGAASANPSRLDTTCALAALTIVSALAFTRVFTSSAWVVPVIGAALVGHGVAWRLRRTRLPSAVAVMVALGAVGVAVMYLVLPGDLTWGLPLGHMLHGLGDSIRRSGSQLHGAVTPVHAEPGYSLLVAWGTGTAAVSADVLAFRVSSPLQALVPPVALFCTASAIGTSQGRAWTVGLEVAALVGFLLVEHISAERSQAVWFGGRGKHTTRSLVTGAGIVAAFSVVAAVAITPAIPAREGDGLLGWRDAPGASGSDRITPSPLDDLRVRLLNNPDTVVMTVYSSQPSYWRLTSLDSFNGTVWSANDSYRNVARHLPGVSISADTRQVQEEFSISALDSIWLPTGFNPEAVTNIEGVSWDANSGSLISTAPTSDGQVYDVFASQQLASLSPSSLAATPAVAAGTLPQDLALPTNLPAPVRQLAARLTAGDTTEYAKAYALEQYFHQAPFYYTTNPPSNDSVDALSSFLFSTHAGYCQQFAGAYAVLARAVGLPTRIAVGFQTGAMKGSGYTVTDADAHAWPEVWFPTLGWVPFEPTPGRQVPGATYTGNTHTALTQPAVASTPTTTVAPSGDDLRLPHRVATRPSTATTAPAASTAGSHGSHTLGRAGLLIGIVIGAAVLWTASLVAIRRTRWRRRRMRARRPSLGGAFTSAGASAGSSATAADGQWSPAADRRAAANRVLVCWAEVAEVLAWWRMRRRSDETVSEFAERAVKELRAAQAGEAVGRNLRALAALVRLAEFSDAQLSPEAADDAEARAKVVIDELRHSAPRGRRIEHLVDPRHALGASTVSAPLDVVAGTRR